VFVHVSIILVIIYSLKIVGIEMAGLSFRHLKSLETGLKSIQAIRAMTGRTVQLLKSNVQIRAMSCAPSAVNSTSPIDKNIVYSRHQDFDLRTQTVVQRFFERASMWPNLTATVSSFFSLV
jgi:hypothetical protein